MKSSGIVYYYDWDCPSFRTPNKTKTRARPSWTRLLGIGMLALAIGGIAAPMIPRLRMEAQYAYRNVILNLIQDPFFSSNTGSRLGGRDDKVKTVFNPLKQPDGSIIEPVDREFGLIIPKIGVNARIAPNINPTKEKEYTEALKTGIAHSSFSYMPDEEGTVYLFSHSTNYDWFVSDLNAVFYLLKNLETGDTAVISYKNTHYTYKITGKQVVKPSEIEYLVPQAGSRRLILQTCWPPGSISERLLIFADLVQEEHQKI